MRGTASLCSYSATVVVRMPIWHTIFVLAPTGLITLCMGSWEGKTSQHEYSTPYKYPQNRDKLKRKMKKVLTMNTSSST